MEGSDLVVEGQTPVLEIKGVQPLGVLTEWPRGDLEQSTLTPHGTWIPTKHWHCSNMTNNCWLRFEIIKQTNKLNFYAPIFKEVDGAYWFGSVRPVHCSPV